MKKINNLLVLVSIVSSLLIIFLLNKEMIPLHFNKLGVVDRYGSKFELLLMPFFVIIIYLIIISIKRYLKCDAILFDFLSFEMLLFMNFLFLIIYVNIFFIVNSNYKGFKYRTVAHVFFLILFCILELKSKIYRQVQKIKKYN